MLYKSICLKQYFFIALFLIFSYSIALGTEKKICSANEQFEFANSLFNRELYNSSIIEFQRFLFLFPKDDRRLKVHYQIGMAYQMQKKYILAADAYQKIINLHSMTETTLQAGYRLNECYQEQNNFQMAKSVLEALGQLNLNPHDRDELDYRMGWLFIQMKQFSLAENHFFAIKEQSAYPIAEILAGIEKRKSLPKKKPYLAGMLSIIPGLGQAYCGRYRDAMLSMIVNGIIGWTVWESYENHQPALGTLLSFFGFGFYAGNIYGATNSAHKFNRRTEYRWFYRLDTQYRDNHKGNVFFQ
ncbi:MAG: hypothetical protein HQK75_17895 [Candidatus Magnetomorum sp.]|nr:hypothetical protein [Candidatus Magnetomorum sp.]